MEQRLQLARLTTTTAGWTCSSATTCAGRAKSTWPRTFRWTAGHRAYGPPLAFEGAYPYVYRNDGDGHFTDVSQEMGVQVTNPATGVPMAKSLGVAPSTWTVTVGSMWSSPTTPCRIRVPQPAGGRFEEIGAAAGVAFDNMGKARGAMGIDAARFRNDDTLGIVDRQLRQ